MHRLPNVFKAIFSPLILARGMSRFIDALPMQIPAGIWTIEFQIIQNIDLPDGEFPGAFNSCEIIMGNVRYPIMVDTVIGFKATFDQDFNQDFYVDVLGTGATNGSGEDNGISGFVLAKNIAQ